MTKFDDVRRDDVREWLSWSLLDSHLHEVEAEADPDRLALLEWAFGLIQARSAQTIPPGRGVNVRPLRLTLDYVRIDQRPLLLYLVINGINAWTVWNAKRVGFQAQRFEGIEYLIRPARRKASPLKPLLFWHGLGIGLGQYTACFDYLARDPRLDGRTIIVLRQPHIRCAHPLSH